MNFSISHRQPPARSYKKRELYRLLIARSDITAALNACDLIIKNVATLKDDLLYPLTTAVVVCYARPFTENKPHGALPKRYIKFDNPLHQEVHDKLIKARHEAFAHSDMNIRWAQIVSPNVVFGKTETGIDLKGVDVGIQVRYYLWAPDFFTKVRETILDLGQRLQRDIEELKDNLYKGMELPNAPFKIRIDEGL